MKRHMKHWQDAASTLVGVWLMASPWVLGIDLHTSVAAFGCCVVIGTLLFACGICEFFIPESWEEYSEVYLGALLLISPWMLEYKSLGAATSNAVICGTAILVLALSVLVTDDQFGWARKRLTH